MSSVAQTLHLALQHHQAGNLQQAELLYRQILQIDPGHVDALHLFGVIAHQKGNNDLAVDFIQRALRFNPANPDAWSNLGLALLAQRKLEEALASFQQAIRLKPDFVGVYNNMASALNDLGRRDEAVASYRQALHLQPGYAEAHSNLGNVLKDQEKLDEAIASYEQALRLRPDYPEAHNNLGNALKDQGKLDEAVASYRQALRLKPDYAEAHLNLGLAQQSQGKLEEAMASNGQAIVHKPDYADAHFNRAMLLLLQGNFAEGWAEYEWRWRSNDFLATNSSRPSSSKGYWDGSSVRGRNVLLHAEQGLGDTIQLIRYAPLLKQQGAAQVVLGCSPALLRLMAHCSGIDKIVTTAQMSAFDIHACLFSLPYLLGTTAVDRIPGNVPYLDSDPSLVEQWEARLTALGARRPLLRVGIVWQGNPDHKGDRWRSVRLERFAPLAEQTGVRLVSLQKGVGREQLEKMPGLAVDLGPALTDLADTAAVIRCLDLVITVDTALAHLAGALGAPVWVALPMVPDWRWLLDRADSPWYPSMRLFRQAVHGQWDVVFHRIKSALDAYPRRSQA